MNNSIKIVSIEGNIGSGKSTLLANLRKYFDNNTNIIFLKEPVDEWSKIKDENGTTILEKFYAHQDKYSFSFQMMAYISRLKLLKDTINEIKIKQNKLMKEDHQNYIIITERSLFTDKMVFAKMLYDSGKIEYVNYQIYLNWFNTFSEEFPIHKVIYVKTDAKICNERILTRHRGGEENIPIDYLKSCGDYHDNIYENEDVLKEWINSIEKFIYK